MADLIMMLSGEDTQQRHRSKKAIELYQSYRGNVPILVSGSHSGYLGRKVPDKMKPECHQARDFLVSHGIPRSDIWLEESSLDTLGNFYFSYPLILPEQKSIDLVTDHFHIDRSLWCANQVFGKRKHFSPRETDQVLPTQAQNLFERIQVAILSYDMNKHGVKEGDYEALARFMGEAHPFYCSGWPAPSLFGAMVGLFSSRRLMMLLPTQRQAYKDLEQV